MPNAINLTMLSARWRLPLLALALSFMHLTARADVWAYADEWGVAHVAATQKDERYQLVFKAADIARPERWNPVARQQPVRYELLAFTSLPKRFNGMYESSGYKQAQEHLQTAADEHQVDYALLKAVAAVESGFRANAVSAQGAVGLMQIKPSTARRYGVLDGESGLTDPRTNIDAGARHLARLIKLFKGELQLAVAAYNAGENAVLRAGSKVPDYPETQGYVKTVMGLYFLFKSAPPARS